MKIEHLDRIAYLLFQGFTDTLSDEERDELEQWLTADSKNQQLWQDMHRRNFYSEKEVMLRLYGEGAAFQKVQLRRRRHLFRKRMLRWGMGAAAIAVIIVGIVSMMLDFSPPIELSGDTGVQLPAGESRAILTLGNGQRLELTRRMNDSVIPGLGVRLDRNGEVAEYRREPAANSETAFNVMEVPRKGEFRLVLSDGTKVWLNSESRLKYPVFFQDSERRVYLEGEAYFEVSENKELPFIVDMSKATVRVLGTSFNARAYPDETCIYATLAEGRIQLNVGKREMILHPEEQGVVELASGNLWCKKVDIRLYTGWKDGRFIFQEQTLEDMMNTLARWYDIQVFFENTAVRQVTFSGNLKRYESFDKIIELLEMTGMAHFKVNGNTILISE